MTYVHDIDTCDSIVELANSLMMYSYYEKSAEIFTELNDGCIQTELEKISFGELELSISLALSKLGIPVSELADIYLLADKSNAAQSKLLSYIAAKSNKYQQITKSYGI